MSTLDELFTCLCRKFVEIFTSNNRFWLNDKILLESWPWTTRDSAATWCISGVYARWGSSLARLRAKGSWTWIWSIAAIDVGGMRVTASHEGIVNGSKILDLFSNLVFPAHVSSWIKSRSTNPILNGAACACACCLQRTRRGNRPDDARNHSGRHLAWKRREQSQGALSVRQGHVSGDEACDDAQEGDTRTRWCVECTWTSNFREGSPLQRASRDCKKRMRQWQAKRWSRLSPVHELHERQREAATMRLERCH